MGRGASLLAVALVLAPTAGTARPPSPAWRIICGAGTDEFASNCTATGRTGGFQFDLSTGDSQFFVNVTASACSPPDGYAGRNWFRDQVAFLDYPRRRKLVEAALREAAAEIARRCPAAGLTPPTFDEIPDIAALGEPGS